MRKRSATAAPEDFNFVKAYFELKRLREDIECIERSSKPPSGKVSAADSNGPKIDDGVQGILRP
jgi:hypothetical protein